MLAAENHDNTDLLQLLLDAGGDLHLRSTERGWTALHFAAYKNNFLAVKTLLDSGANPLITSHHLETPLHLACLNGLNCLALFLSWDVTQREKLLDLCTLDGWRAENIVDEPENIALFKAARGDIEHHLLHQETHRPTHSNAFRRI